MVKEAINSKTEQALIQFLVSKIKIFKRIDAAIMNEHLTEKYNLSIDEVNQIISNNNVLQQTIFKCSTHYHLKPVHLKLESA